MGAPSMKPNGCRFEGSRGTQWVPPDLPLRFVGTSDIAFLTSHLSAGRIGPGDRPSVNAAGAECGVARSVAESRHGTDVAGTGQ